MPTTRVAYPRATVCYDEAGQEVFRIISLWVIMNLDTRAMILPGKSGIQVAGLCQGTELPAPASLAPAVTNNHKTRTVRYSDLDRNGHMNNCRYLEWAGDLLPSPFHKEHQMKEFVVCYLSEAREGEQLELAWRQDEEGFLQVEILRQNEAETAGHSRVCAVKIQY
jgi:acyl-ACP thioesterase